MNKALIAGLLATAFAGSSLAADLPDYGNVGQANLETYSFTAASTGNLSAYFVGADASFDETLGVLVNGVASPVTGLPNHGSTFGQRLDFGHVHAGDKLTFFIDVKTTGTRFFSDAGLNADLTNHIYSTAFSGNGSIPAGTYVGFEDLFHGGDFDYNDQRYVFNNVASCVPEPTSIALMLAGVGLVGFAARRRRV